MIIMCGIFGTAGFSDKALLRKMGNLMRYRGPDDQGFFTDTGIGMGMRRLSIIDIKGGRQPIHNENRDIWVVFNGEIYNYKELRKELEKKHRFYTNSDTEAIVHAYEEYGLGFAGKLNGMFAIALWDSRKKTLVIARDRAGKKPLYYTNVDEGMIFASEMKALLLNGNVKRKVNDKILHHYLTLRYCPGNETMLKDVYKLLPGHMIVWKKKSMIIKKYWSLEPRMPENRTENFYVCKLRGLLEDAVKSRLVSDVPLGVYLSGGLDSTAIVGLMKNVGAEHINTFSIGFGLDSDETSYAKSAADFYGANHREFIINKTDVRKLMPEIVWHLDEPLADITNIPTYLISQLAQKHVTVVLTGEGSDELFSGYAHEKGMLKAQKMKSMASISRKVMPGMIRHAPLSMLNKLFEYPASMGDKGRERMSEFMKNIGDESGMYTTLVSSFDEKEKNSLCTKTANYPGTKNLFEEYFSCDTTLSNKMLLVDVNMWLPDYILLRLDRMTMANSLEGRAPFIDYRLVEFSSTIPQSMKRGDKMILRKAVRDIMPPEILNRKKRTFITPMHMWGEKYLMDMSGMLYESEFFRKDYIEKIIEDYKNSKLIRERQLWTMITFELWHKTFIEGKGLKPINI